MLRVELGAPGDELRQVLRRLRRRPFATAVAVLTLAVAIGAATAIFGVAEAVVLRPLPYAEPHRLVLVWQQDRERGQAFVEMSYPTFRDWRADHAVFKDLAGFPSTNQGWVLTGRGEPVHVAGRLVSSNFFDVLGVRPALGRGFREEEDRRGAGRVVVLADSLWRARFAADPGIVGRAIVLDDAPFTVVGVMPRSFAFPAGAEIWTPVVPGIPELAEKPDVWWMSGLGRLRPGVSLAQARRDLAAKASAYNREKYQAPGVTTVLTPLHEAVLGATRPVLLALLGGVALVLLVGCANVSVLLALAAEARSGELAVRLAFGASVARVTRELLVETLAVALLGAAVGGALAVTAIPLLVALSPPDVPRLADAGVSLPVLAFAVVVTLTAAALTSLAPALVARRRSPRESLLAASRQHVSGRSRLRAVLVAAEVGLALVLLVGAGLLVRSLLALQRAPLGYDPAGVLAVDAGPSEREYPTARQQRDYVDELLRRVRSLPDVEAAAAVTLRPLWGSVGMDWPFTIEGQSAAEAERNPLVNFETVTPDYFRTMRLPLRRGRAFVEDDREGRPGVVIVSEALARSYWPGQDPIGKRLKLPLPPTEYHDRWLSVVGVAADARYRELTATRLDIYMSSFQSDHRPHHLVVRSRGPSAFTAAALRRVVRELHPSQPAPEVVAMTDAVRAAVAIPRFAVRVLCAFAATATLLAALGLYGIVAAAVSRRTPEIGLRVVLGARPPSIARMVVAEALRPAVAGLSFGVAGAVAAARLARSLLYGVAASDPLTIVSACCLLLLVALSASVQPLRRALRLDPAETLREM